MVSSSQSSVDIPVAYHPPEIIPDSQPDPHRFDEEVKILAGPPKSKKKITQERAAEDNDDDGVPPELVESEAENSEDEEEDKETEQYLSRFQSTQAQVIQTPNQKKKRQRVIPRRPSKFQCLKCYYSICSIQKNSCY